MYFSSANLRICTPVFRIFYNLDFIFEIYVLINILRFTPNYASNKRELFIANNDMD